MKAYPGVYRLEKTLIEELREKIASDQFEFSKHAVGQIIARRISVQELREVVEGGEVDSSLR